MERLERFTLDTPGLGYQIALARLQKDLPGDILSNASEAGEVIGHLAETYRRLGDATRALNFFSKSFRLWQHLGVANRMCWCLWGIGGTLRSAGRHDVSRRWFERALALARSARERRCQAWAFAELAEIDRIVGNHRKALSAHYEVLEEFRSLGDVKGVSWAYSGIGQILRMRADLAGADRAFFISENIGALSDDEVGEAWALRGRAEVAKERGDFAAAEALAQLAVGKFERKGYPTGIAYARKTVAEIQLLSDRPVEAKENTESALMTFSQSGDRRGVAFALKTMGDVEASLGMSSEAVARYEAAHGILVGLKVSELTTFNPADSLAHLKRRLDAKRTFAVAASALFR